jgi:putative membrane protein
MWWWWGQGGWVGGLVTFAIIVGIVVVAVILLRHDLPNLQSRFGDPPALRLLEERYARGEITRDEFLERRRVLLEGPAPQPTVPPNPAPMPPQPQAPGPSDPTKPLPPPET